MPAMPAIPKRPCPDYSIGVATGVSLGMSKTSRRRRRHGRGTSQQSSGTTPSPAAIRHDIHGPPFRLVSLVLLLLLCLLRLWLLLLLLLLLRLLRL